jgi:hypothetical protein
MKDWKVIHSYTRAQAIADGVLVDVSELAKEAGFRFPVAVTSGVWAECVRVPEGVTGQDETGRLWDVLTMLRFAIARQKRDATRIVPRFALPGQTAPGERVDIAVHVRNDDGEGDPPLVQLYALCGPGDNAEPVITVMLIGED